MRIPLPHALTALLLPPTVASGIGAAVIPDYRVSVTPPVMLAPVSAESAEGLVRDLEREGLDWPPSETVPRAGIRDLPPDLDRLDVSTRKRVFLASLTPLVLAENRRLTSQRRFLEALASLDGRVPKAARPRLTRLMAHYRVEGDWADPTVRARLLRRADTVPVSLALAQAAIESGWGTSRFAREANNLFGIWTWDTSQGLRARRAGEDARHRVRRYEDLQAAVRSYLYNINVGRAYRDLRRLRAEARAQGRSPDAHTLASGLTRYSARGEAYVTEVRDLIRVNELQVADAVAFEAPHPWVAALFGPMLR